MRVARPATGRRTTVDGVISREGRSARSADSGGRLRERAGINSATAAPTIRKCINERHHARAIDFIV
jgi:hypothetical protein